MPKVSQAHRDARRAQIIAAASACFSREGLHNATMPDIIRQSGLSAGAIYNYFGSKDEITEAIADERHQCERKAIGDASKQSDFGAALRQLSRYFSDALATAEERERRRVGIQFWAEALHNEHLLTVVRRGIDEPREMLAAAAANAQRQRRLRADLDPDAVARVFIALFHGFILQQAWDKHAAIEPYLGVVDAILAGLTPENKSGDGAAPRPRRRSDGNKAHPKGPQSPSSQSRRRQR